MATPVPAVDRAAAVMTYLSERQFSAHSLTEIARGAGINKATCSAILTALAAHALVERDDDRRYSLGPQLLRLAHAYREQFRAFILGREEICRLSIDVGLSCSATVVDKGQLVTLDIFGDTSPGYMPHRIGRIVPFTPPHGTIFKAWSSPEEIDIWLAEVERQGGGQAEQLKASVSAIRARGYSLGSEHDFDVELDRALKFLEQVGVDADGVSVASLVAAKFRDYRAAGVTEDSEDAYFNFVLGPVFGHDGSVVMSVNLFGGPGQIRRRDLDTLGPRLLATAQKITEMVGGVHPLDLAAISSGTPL